METAHSIPDLSRKTGLISSLFRWPEREEDWQAYRLSEEQIGFYHEHGYLSGIKLLDHAQVEALRAELDELIRPGLAGKELFHEYHSNESSDPDAVLFHALGHWRITPGFHDVLWNPAFVMAASQLLGGSVRFWHDQLFYKPARHGGVVAWHQDYSYWTRTRPMEHLTCWTALDDTDEENGCLQYVPGSHRWNLLDMPELAGDMNGIFRFLDQRQAAEFKPLPVPLQKGYATFHHPLLVHGSYQNRSERPRRAFVINVFKDGVLSDTDEPLLNGVPPVPKGQKMEGQFFPLLSGNEDAAMQGK